MKPMDFALKWCFRKIRAEFSFQFRVFVRVVGYVGVVVGEGLEVEGGKIGWGESL